MKATCSPICCNTKPAPARSNGGTCHPALAYADACRDEDFLLPEGVLEELQEEAAVMVRMRHPNIVSAAGMQCSACMGMRCCHAHACMHACLLITAVHFTNLQVSFMGICLTPPCIVTGTAAAALHGREAAHVCMTTCCCRVVRQGLAV